MATTLEYLRTKRRDEMLALAQQHGKNDVRIFGSVLRAEEEDESVLIFWTDLAKAVT